MGMARRNRSAAGSDTRAPDSHTPSSPTRPPIVSIYCGREDAADKLLVTSWATWAGAAAFLETLIEDQEGEPKWLKHRLGRWTQLVWPSGLTVTTRDDDTLEKLAEAETTWTLPEPYVSEIRQFLGDGPVLGAEFERRPKERGIPDPSKPPREKKEKKPSGPKAPAGWLHVSALVPDVQPPVARAALRSLGWTKPAFGWWFDPAEQIKVTKAIKGAIK
jgi:hypothetical protein